MVRIPYSEIHSFAAPGEPFTGNPAGVCRLERFPGDAVMRGIAASNALSETAFVVPRGDDVWDLRWFTPTVEVDLCGHATFAAGAVLFESGQVAGDTVGFDTRSGRLEVARDESGFAMDLPAIGFKPGRHAPALEAALGLQGSPEAVLDVNRIHGAGYQMWVLSDASLVRSAEPDHGLLKKLNTNVILTAPGGADLDFVSRFFAPASGVDEDPVTGSAHCTLAPYWAERLGKSRMKARQIGPRPGALEVETREERVTLYGHAPHFLSGEIVLPEGSFT